MQIIRRSLFSLLSACALIAQAGVMAQSPAPSRATVATEARASVRALFLSDIHLDPFADPAKVARLNAAPASEWPAILSAPDSPTRAKEFTALQEACQVRGVDTPWGLLRSSLAAIHDDAAQARFITLSGDLLAHSFDCKYKTLLPAATPADLLAFSEKTVRTVVSTLRAALPGVPLYVAMGNNDSGCGDYQLDATHDAFLGLVSKIIGEALPGDLPASERAAAVRDFSTGGNYNVPLAGVPHARLVVIDDIFLSGKYSTCAGKPGAAPAAAQLAWLAGQIATARQHGEQVWVMGHIPPGVDMYSTAHRLSNICAGGKPQMFLSSESLAGLLSQNADVVRLALFGHTHDDEMRLLTPEPGPTNAHAQTAYGVPLKIVASITPINGNRPTFTLATIDPATATLADYTVFMASNSTGIGSIWSKEYTYSTTYHEPAFDAASLATLISRFRSDPAAKSAASQAYLRDYYPGDISTMIQVVWPQYACSLDHDSAASFTACACAAGK